MSPATKDAAQLAAPVHFASSKGKTIKLLKRDNFSIPVRPSRNLNL
jgi:hypothetical protein